MNAITSFFDVGSIAFTFLGNQVSYLELICFLSGLSCVFLAGRNNKQNFWIGYVYNIFLFILLLQKHYYSSMLLQPIAVGFNILGQYRWSHPKKGEESKSDKKALKVSSMSWLERGLTILVIAICTLIWGFVLTKLGVEWYPGVFQPDPSPFLDAFLLILTLTALYFSAQKKWECWVLWLLVNLFNIILYLQVGLRFMPLVSFMYLLNGLWAMWTWYRLYKKDLSNE